MSAREWVVLLGIIILSGCSGVKQSKLEPGPGEEGKTVPAEKSELAVVQEQAALPEPSSLEIKQPETGVLILPGPATATGREEIANKLEPVENNRSPEVEAPPVSVVNDNTENGVLLAKKVEPPLEETLKAAGPPEIMRQQPVLSLSGFRGECLFFEARWNLATLGKAMMACQEERNRYGKVYHLVGITVPTGLPAKLGYGFNRVDAYVNPETFEPYYFYTYTRAGKTERITEVEFETGEKLFTWTGRKYKEGKLTETKGGRVKYTQPVYDSIGVFYRMRMDNFKAGEEAKYPVALTKLWTLTVRYRERIKRKLPLLGLREFLVLEPEVASDEGLFTQGKMVLWLTADDNRLPAYLHGKIVLGSAKLELISTRKLEATAVLNQETISSLLASM
ncbi:MAG TPA: DUF3108 domain-containing protein [bacterium]|nr:DUF3108 domain-containing protein [bacterium]